MSEYVSLVMMLFLAVLGGTIATFVISKKNQLNRKAQLFFTWVLSCYLEYLLISCFRIILLRGNGVFAYSQDMWLFIFDVIFVALGAFFLQLRSKREDSKILLEESVSCILVLIYYIILFIICYLQNNNVNAAIYSVLLPDKTLGAGIVLFCWKLISHSVFFKQIQKNDRNKQNMKWSVISLFVITTIVCPVFETYITNAKEFSFSVKQIWYWFILLIAIVSIGINIFCKIIDKKQEECFLFTLWCISICSYIQGMFLNNKLFLMDGKKAEWGLEVQVFNFILWCGMIVSLFCLYKFSKKYQKEVILYSSVGLCIMQLAGSISLLPNYEKQESESTIVNNYLSDKGLYEVAAEDNIIIFVLDTYDVDYIEEILEDEPDFLEPLKGFTYFPDMVSQFSRTFPSITYMLTEKKYFYEIPQNEYIDNAFATCDFWNRLEEQGFSYYLYEENEECIGKAVIEKAQNFIKDGHVIREKISFQGVAEAVFRMNAYRILPYVLKEYYIYTSNTINNLVIEDRILDVPMFMADDVMVYNGLRKNEIVISNEEKALRFIHLNGAHAPYTMKADGTGVSADKGVPEEQYIGCMNLVYDYLEILQKLGLYEKSTIIITADHGENYVTTQLEQNTNPILFIKPHGVGMEKELEISDIYASQNDLLPTISAMYNIDYYSQESMDLFSADGKDKERIRYHYYAVVENTLQTKTRTYEIRGSALDFNNWCATDEYHEFGKYY